MNALLPVGIIILGIAIIIFLFAREEFGRGELAVMGAGILLLLGLMIFGSSRGEVSNRDVAQSDGALPQPARTQLATAAEQPTYTSPVTFTASAAHTMSPATRIPVATATSQMPARTSSAREAMPAVTTTATPSPAAENETSDLLQRLVVAEEALHSGHFTAAVDLGGGTRSETEMRFDLGTPARIHVWSTYTSSSGAQETENIMIGAEQWQRVDGGNWSALASVEPALAILQKYLPHASTATDSEFLKAGTLQWHDQADKSDVTVTVDTATGVPRHMERQFRSSGLSLGVTFTGWNTPVNIVAPE